MRPTVALCLGLLWAAPATIAQENAYDFVGRAARPFIDLFLENPKGPNRALQLSLELEENPRLPDGVSRKPLALAVEAPDRLRADADLGGTRITVCRAGDRIWLHPGGQARSLLGQIKNLPPEDPGATLAPLRLPVGDTQAAFFPALLRVADRGLADVGGRECRVIDLALIPELEKAMGLEGWVARLAAEPESARPVRLEVRGPDWHGAIWFREVRFAPSFSRETWRPAQDQSGDILEVGAPRFYQLLAALMAK